MTRVKIFNFFVQTFQPKSQLWFQNFFIRIKQRRKKVFFITEDAASKAEELFLTKRRPRARIRAWQVRALSPKRWTSDPSVPTSALASNWRQFASNLRHIEKRWAFLSLKNRSLSSSTNYFRIFCLKRWKLKSFSRRRFFNRKKIIFQFLTNFWSRVSAS